MQLSQRFHHVNTGLNLLICSLLCAATLLIPAGCQSPNESTGTTASATTAISETTAPTTTTTPSETDATTAASATASETTAPPATETTGAPLPANPLTGEPLISAQAAGKRPVAIMINNIRIATPQIGISQADLIYEMPVEGGITRLMAVFADVTQIPEIGSIRSARHDYIDLCGGLDALYIHFGESNLARDQFERQKTAHISLGSYPSAFWRDQNWMTQRGKEHSVKTNGGLLEQVIAQTNYRVTIRDGQKPAFQFRAVGEFAAASGKPANQVNAPFSTYNTATFTYDAGTQLYSKGQFGEAQLDLATGEPIRFTNIFLLLTKVSLCQDGVHKEIDLSSGKGYYLAGGQYQPITWKKGSTNDSFVFKDDKGQELLVNTGKSYIGVLPSSNKISFK